MIDHLRRGASAAGPDDLPVPEWGADEVRGAIEQILARAEFREPTRSFLDEARSWFTDQLDRVIVALLEGGGAGLLGWMLVALAVVAAIVFAIRFGRGVQADPGVAETVSPPSRRGAVDWRADAETHEAAGDWRAALRCRYRALVASLADRGVVDEIPGRTAGEYRAEVTSSLPAAADPFAAATDLFELAWYANRPTGPDEATQFRTLADRVLQGASR